MIVESPRQMQRDMDLVRLLMLKLAGEDVDKELEPYDFRQINYHELLILEAGFAKGSKSVRADGWEQPFLMCLTWEGQEFLDSIRSLSIWNAVKARASKIGAFTIPVIQTLAGEVIKATLLK